VCISQGFSRRSTLKELYPTIRNLGSEKVSREGVAAGASESTQPPLPIIYDDKASNAQSIVNTRSRFGTPIFSGRSPNQIRGLSSRVHSFFYKVNTHTFIN
jgi:hypothetical protein